MSGCRTVVGQRLRRALLRQTSSSADVPTVAQSPTCSLLLSFGTNSWSMQNLTLRARVVSTRRWAAQGAAATASAPADVAEAPPSLLLQLEDEVEHVHSLFRLVLDLQVRGGAARVVWALGRAWARSAAAARLGLLQRVHFLRFLPPHEAESPLELDHHRVDDIAAGDVDVVVIIAVAACIIRALRDFLLRTSEEAGSPAGQRASAAP